MSGNREVKANYQQLKGAYKSHGKIADGGDDGAHNLLRFYANECGLKALFLRDNNLKDTGDLEESTGRKYGYSHDLRRWVDELKIPAFAIPYNEHPNDPIKQVHEKLRYGVEVDKKHLRYLSALYKALKKQL